MRVPGQKNYKVVVWRLGLKYFFLNGSNWKERRQI